MLQECVQAIVDYFDTSFARIWQINDDDTHLELKASAGRYIHLDGDHGRISLDLDLKVPAIAKTRQPYLTNSVPGDPIIDQEWAQQEGLQSFAGYPLVAKNRVIGVIGTFSKNILTQNIISALGIVARIMAITIDYKRKEAELLASNVSLEQALSDQHLEFKARLAVEDRFRTLIDTIGDGVVALDYNGFVLHVNPAMTKMFGYTIEELLGNDIHKLLAPTDLYARADAAMKLFMQIGQGKMIDKTIVLPAKHKDGSALTIELTLSAYRYENVWCPIAVIRDITDRILREKVQAYARMVDEQMRDRLLTELADRDES